MAYISCKDLKLGYDGMTVTKDINFTINKGDYLCIVGENGAGKSTLMKTILGLLDPISGEIIYSDDLKSYDIGYLPQQTNVQKDFPASVWEVVLSGNISKNKNKIFYSKKDKELAKSNLEKMGIYHLKDKCYRNLSGGQQQRVLLARAICATDKILILDEPVSGLDPKVTKELYELIKLLNDEGITIVIISHDINSSIEYASHILHIGKTQLFFGTKHDYINSEAAKMFVLREN